MKMKLFIDKGIPRQTKQPEKKQDTEIYLEIRSWYSNHPSHDSPGLVDFVVGLVEFILHLPDGQVKNCNVPDFSIYLASCRVQTRTEIEQTSEVFASKLEDASPAAIFFFALNQNCVVCKALWEKK